MNRWTMRIDGAIVPDGRSIGGKAASIARTRCLGRRVRSASVIAPGTHRVFAVAPAAGGRLFLDAQR